MLSCSVIFTCLIVSVACVASACRDSPRTLALDWKLESQTAISPPDRGGMSLGGAVESNGRFATATGCLMMTGGAAPRKYCLDAEFRQASHATTRAASTTQNASKPRE